MGKSAAKTSTADADNTQVGSGTPVTDEATSAVREILAETEQASQQADAALAEEGIKVARAERRERTGEQMRKSAKRQRKYGRLLLGKKESGIAAVVTEVTINNFVLASAFERLFPIIDQSAYLVNRRGEVAFGERVATQIIDRFNETINTILTETRQQLEAAKALVGELSVNQAYAVIPSYTAPAFNQVVQIKSPQGIRALDIFKAADALLCEVETLHWNHVRSVSERNDEIHRAKKALFPLFRFAASTTRNLHHKLRDSLGNGEGVDTDAAAPIATENPESATTAA
ncbi:MAG: hypothetical protein WAO76_18415 [Georgfuchsia sp.]